MTAIRLSGREWLIVAAALLVLIVGEPLLWRHAESLPSDTDYRIPYNLNSDYWLYAGLCTRTSEQHKMAIIGDSVIWGHYVAPNQTLSHYLNETTGRDQFANLGLDGTHPAALQGLLKYYARALSHQVIVLHFNPLWISSEKHDLSTTKEFQFNHPKLVPQFTPRIPCYRASFSQRVNAVSERYVPFLSWTAHLRIACFDGLDLPAWTIEHPYENPLTAIANCSLRIADLRAESNSQSAISNSQSIDVQWVALEDSIQWRSFRQAIELLKARQSRVFVLVGPFNEHLLNPEDATAYDRIKKTIDEWLTDQGVPHAMAPVLPASLYADLSHPVAEGYARLARQLLSEPSFQAMMDSRPDR
jgi:hypothetical protein